MATTQEYAYLAEHVYDTKILVGVRQPDEQKKYTIGGKNYLVLEHASNLKNGYQGTIYQDVNSGEIIVAHRGTESPTDAKVDALMINSRTNIQAEDAIALTKHAQEYAEFQHRQNPKLQTPQVTTTGHSLGGTLAQITAHHYGLSGEAFNPYGAASLDRHIPAGQGHFTNHVMAGDAVSAASPQYGQTRVYASAIDTIALETHDKARGVRGSTLTTAAALVNDHFMANFTGHGDTDNILNDRQAGLRATQHWPAIEHYREDVSNNRQIAMVAFISPQGIANLIDEYKVERQPSIQHYQSSPDKYSPSSDASETLKDTNPTQTATISPGNSNSTKW